MLLWWKEYIRDWKIHILLVLQMVLVLDMISIQAVGIKQQYNRLICVEQKEQNVYFCQNVLEMMAKDNSLQAFKSALQKVKDMDGVCDVAYGQSVYCDIDGYVNPSTGETGFIQNININDIFAKCIRYHLSDGHWFGEESTSDDRIEVIIGGGLSMIYSVGDTIHVQFPDGTAEDAYVIGDLGKEVYLLGEGYGKSSEDISGFVELRDEQSDILLSCEEGWLEQFEEYVELDKRNIFVQVEPTADLTAMKDYGLVISFDQVMDKTRQETKRYVFYVLEENMIWILVILLAVTVAFYVISQKKKYMWGVYLMNGMTGMQVYWWQMSQNLLTYLISVVLYIVTYTFVTAKIYYPMKVQGIQLFTAVVLLSLVFMMSLYYHRDIRKMSPKVILDQTKE